MQVAYLARVDLPHVHLSDKELHGSETHEVGHHAISLHFLANDILMALFFGIATKEIAEAFLPGGSLNPMSKAINPLFATVGGVLGPILAFFGLNAIMGKPAWDNGWEIPTAT
jgi:NhaA family Na+:H+ antiporter